MAVNRRRDIIIRYLGKSKLTANGSIFNISVRARRHAGT